MGPGRVAPVVVNQAFAREYFPGQSAVGQAARIGNDCTGLLGSLTIVGVVGDSRADLRAAVAPALFFPLGGFQGPVTLIVRTAGDPASMIPTVRRAMTELNANTPTFSEAPVTDAGGAPPAPRAPAVVAADGLCGRDGVHLLSRHLRNARVRRRAPAPGDQRADRHRRANARCGSSDGAGVVGAGRVRSGRRRRLCRSPPIRGLSQVLYGVSSYDPLTLAGASVLFMLVAVAAAALPSRAAARVNPVLALRQ